MLQAGEPQATRIHVYRTERTGIQNDYGIYKRTEAWYERQTGQDRHSEHSRTGVSEQQPKGIFPPVNVVRACYLEGYTLYYHSRLP